MTYSALAHMLASLECQAASFVALPTWTFSFAAQDDAPRLRMQANTLWQGDRPTWKHVSR